MIRCPDLNHFLNVISGLAMRGLTFEADADALTVKLTGGY